jgi:hypothetical protein
MLQVWWQNHRLVARFPRQLDPQVPRVEGDESELVVLTWDQVRIAEGARGADLVPSQGCQP